MELPITPTAPPYDPPQVEELVKEVPPELIQLIDHLANPNLTFNEIDALMGFEAGKTRRYLSKYPLIARTANEARVLAFRSVGLTAPRLSAYKAYADGLTATRSEQAGLNQWVDVPDHKVRISAADKILKGLGDDVGLTVNYNETELHVKIYNLVQERAKAKAKPIDVPAMSDMSQEKPRGMQVVS